MVTLTKCPICGFPIEAEYEGQAAVCANCGEHLIAQGVTIPTPVFVGLLAFAAGVFFGPALIATSTSGRRWLEEQARIGR